MNPVVAALLIGLCVGLILMDCWHYVSSDEKAGR